MTPETLSLRDYFAAHALNGILCSTFYRERPAGAARLAFELAAAMLIEHEKACAPDTQPTLSRAEQSALEMVLQVGGFFPEDEVALRGLLARLRPNC